jgi:hypothetical protein
MTRWTAVLLALAAGTPQGPDGERTQVVVCKEAGRYIGWPTVARTQQGELIVAFSGDREEHVCPFGKTQLVRSSDGGKTWSPPQTITKTPLDDRDAGLLVTRQGTLVVSWFTSIVFEELPSLKPRLEGAWRDTVSKISAEDRRLWLGHWTRRSTDGGRTWDKPADSIVSAPHGPIELKDGRLLYLGLTQQQGTLKGSPVPDERLMAAADSKDDGKTWSVIGHVPVPKGVPVDDFCELHVVEAAGGSLVAMIRREKPPSAGFLWQTESPDGGKTWTEPHATPLWGYPPHLTRLRDGRVLATYGHRRKPYGQRACLSRDGGKTWDYAHEIVIRDDAPNGDLGYPSSVQLDDEMVFTTYYQIDKRGEKTSLLGTLWKLPRP